MEKVPTAITILSAVIVRSGPSVSSEISRQLRSTNEASAVIISRRFLASWARCICAWCSMT